MGKPIIKVILVGNASVGKTCLISSFFSLPFEQVSAPTVAPAYSCLDITRSDGIEVSEQIWDTAGQERYQSVGKMFYRDADVALICFDPTNKESTESVPRWVESVRDEVENITIILVITKIDLLSESQKLQYQMEAEGTAQQCGASCVFLTSSITQEGVKEVFTQAADVCQIEDKAERTPKERKANSGCC